MKSIIPLKPHASRKIWGGQLLAKLKGLSEDSDLDPVGETWEVSAHKDGPSKSEYGNLNEFSNLEEIPYLIKLIETSDNLSVQVHPNDEFSKKNENQKGKSECWLILDATEGEGIYLGVKSDTTLEKFENSLSKGEDVSSLMNFYPVKRGDFFYVPAGTAHAIGKGVFLAEVQQCSDVTYRVWDWNRIDENGKSRELHVEKAMQVIRFDEEFNYPVNFKIQNDVLRHSEIKLLELSDFELTSFSIEGEREIICGKRYSSIFVLSGEIKIEKEDQSHTAKEYEAVLIPISDNKKVKVSGSGNFLFIR
jgi:mannose-6-phosphate isomerase